MRYTAQVFVALLISFLVLSQPAFAQVSKTSSLSKKDYIMKQINDFRVSKGLSKVKTDSNTCNFARTRVLEITKGFNHDGFNNRGNLHTLPYPSFHFVTENLAKNSDYKAVVQSWINSPGHNANMQKDTPYVCVEDSGIYYAYEGWKP